MGFPHPDAARLGLWSTAINRRRRRRFGRRQSAATRLLPFEEARNVGPRDAPCRSHTLGDQGIDLPSALTLSESCTDGAGTLLASLSVSVALLVPRPRNLPRLGTAGRAASLSFARLLAQPRNPLPRRERE
jgi:hypothetical protein